MADVDLSVTISRTDLGLPPLEIATSPHYYVAPGSFGGQVQWDRNQVSSRYLDGDVTVSRRRRNVTENLAVEVRGAALPEVQAHMDELIAALTQAAYTMTVTVGGARYVYACEAADYQNAMWDASRLNAAQGQAVFQIPRQPLQLAG